jgi:uncharacterized HAD superfamily protein
MMVGLDIDGVLADFLSPFLKILEHRVGKGPIIPESITDPSFIAHPFIPQETIADCMVEVSYDAQFWQELAPLPSPAQWEALNTLSQEGRLVFLTHRYERETYSIHEVTCDWLRKHGVRQPIVYFTQKGKSELVQKLKVRLFVDDRHENCRDVAENTDALVLMPHRPYNGSFRHPKVQRIQDLEELFAHLPNIPSPGSE